MSVCLFPSVIQSANSIQIQKFKLKLANPIQIQKFKLNSKFLHNKWAMGKMSANSTQNLFSPNAEYKP